MASRQRPIAEDHIALARRVATVGPDDDIIEAVAVDIARPADRAAGEVNGVDAVEPEAVGAVEPSAGAWGLEGRRRGGLSLAG